MRRAAGAVPCTCPPVLLESFDLAWLSGRDLLYFNLDGAPGSPYWYGDDYRPALSAAQLEQADLSGAVVFVANCFLPESPMLEVLLKAGAGVVVGGGGKNFSRSGRVGGADLLGLWFRRGLAWGLRPEMALWLARMRLRTIRHKDHPIEDALKFELWRRK